MADIAEQIRERERALGNVASPENDSNEETGVVAREFDPNDDYSRRGRKANSKRVILPIKDGKVAFNEVNETQLATLKQAIAGDESAKAQLGVTVVKPEIPEELCKALLDVVGSVERLTAHLFFGVPSPIAQKAFTFTDEQKDALARPTKKVLDKYVPSDLAKYSEEAELAFALFAVVQQQIALCTEMQKNMREAQPQRPVQ